MTLKIELWSVLPRTPSPPPKKIRWHVDVALSLARPHGAAQMAPWPLYLLESSNLEKEAQGRAEALAGDLARR